MTLVTELQAEFLPVPIKNRIEQQWKELSGYSFSNGNRWHTCQQSIIRRGTYSVAKHVYDCPTPQAIAAILE